MFFRRRRAGHVTTWLPLAFAVTILSALVYGAVQQSYRQSADDPQIQLARDGASSFAHGSFTPPTSQVDLRESLAPFIIIFDASHRVIATGAVLDGRTPTPPTGVFDHTKSHGEDRFTWEPAPGVREAAVVVKAGDGYVLAARSLSEVERRENALWQATLAAWLIGLAGTLWLTWWLPRARQG